MYEILVKDKVSLDAITLGLALNGYFVTTDNITDENYKSYYKISYCLKDEFLKHVNADDTDNNHIV